MLEAPVAEDDDDRSLAVFALLLFTNPYLGRDALGTPLHIASEDKHRPRDLLPALAAFLKRKTSTFLGPRNMAVWRLNVLGSVPRLRFVRDGPRVSPELARRPGTRRRVHGGMRRRPVARDGLNVAARAG
jgi:hypothetical protein